MNGTPIVLARETANDESGSVVAVYFPSGATVDEGDLIFDIENSKVTQELRAPHAGVLHHSLEVGAIVAFGIPIASILSPADARDVSPGLVPVDPTSTDDDGPLDGSGRSIDVDLAIARAPETLVVIGDPACKARFSRAALMLMEELDIDESRFTTGFVTTADVNALLAPSRLENTASLRPAAHASTETTIAPKGGRLVSGSKRAEIDALENGAAGGMLSILGTTIGPLSVRRTEESFLGNRITDLVIYETARLMRKFPKLNAYYEDRQVFQHDEVHAGLAIDGGGRLVVYGIDNADRKGLPDLSHEIAEAVRRYIGGELSADEMSRATYTVTDLSADELDFVFPLLPRGQSCIIGVTRSEQVGFRVFAGFDHRVTEGREVAAFLGELRDRLLSFSCDEARNGVSARCTYCERSVAELDRKNKDRGLLKVVDRHGKDTLCCASCWNGW